LGAQWLTYAKASVSEGGAAEIRTLVRKCNGHAFYMCSATLNSA
jgi:hypothetical protein